MKEFVKEVEIFCANDLSNFKFNMMKDEIFVKLPYRYSRYDFELINCDSDILSSQSIMNIELVISGVIRINDKWTMSYKVKSVSL